MRRLFDIVAVSLMSIAALPVFLIVGTSVLILLGRPVLFSQARAGKGGVPFTMYKFRSMTDARDSEGRLLPDSERTTPFGRLLRRSRLDELPEIWNILVGEMSLIGPRPLLPSTIAALGGRGVQRCMVRPGLTGWAQISGNSVLSDEDKLELDLWYIRNRSYAIDLRIMLATVVVMLCGEKPSASRIAQARRSSGVSSSSV